MCTNQNILQLNLFSILKEHLYNRSKGFLEIYIRNQRSSNPVYHHVKRVYGKRKVTETILEGDVVDQNDEESCIIYLKNLIVSNSNSRDDVSKRMEMIHVNRYIWI